MNRQEQRNRTRKLLHRAFNSKEQVVKINIHNTFTHELAKFLLCWEIAKEGKRFVTEAIFENNKRADILILDDEEAWEILHTETVEEFKKKLDEYPVMAIPFIASTVIESWRGKLK